MKPAACIDIGTNSVLLLVAYPVPGGRLEEMVSTQEITQLGEGLFPDALLKGAAIDRTVAAVGVAFKAAINAGAKHVRIIGTQALRRAKNAPVFLDAVQKTTGRQVSVISGEEESRLSFFAVDRSLSPVTKRIVTDIGGGSTEITWGEKGKPVRSVSIPIGCVTITEEFPHSDHLKMVAAVASRIASGVSTSEASKDMFCGCGGTCTALAAIELGLESYDARRIQGHVINKKWIEIITFPLLANSSSRGEPIGCVSSKRIAVLGAGIEILLGVMRALGKDQVIVSDAGLRHGVLWEYFESVLNKKSIYDHNPE